MQLHQLRIALARPQESSVAHTVEVLQVSVARRAMGSSEAKAPGIFLFFFFLPLEGHSSQGDPSRHLDWLVGAQSSIRARVLGSSDMDHRSTLVLEHRGTCCSCGTSSWGRSPVKPEFGDLGAHQSDSAQRRMECSSSMGPGMARCSSGLGPEGRVP